MYQNPLLDAEVTVEFTSPGGKATTVRAFWDYGPNWKARFQPDVTGRWTYRWRSSDAADESLSSVRGEFECVPFTGDNPLHRHGAVHVAPTGRYFAHADGSPFFWLGDTAWNGALLASPDEWETYLSDRAAKRFSVVQFVMTQWRSATGDEDGRPPFIVRRGKIEVDPVFFQRMDERVDAINRHGLLAAPVLFWANGGHPEMNPGLFLSEEQLVAMGRYMVARYGAHHVAWILAGDGHYEGERIEIWKRVGRTLFGAAAPAIPRPATMHAVGRYWCGPFATEDWFSFQGYQSGHRRLEGLADIVRGAPATEWQGDPKRPVMNIEPCYEAHRNRAPNAKPDDVFDDADVRRAAWLSLLSAPTAGLTYGAHGIWSWHPRPVEPMTHPGTGVGPAWYDAIHLPGSGQLAHMAEFFAGFEWWKLRPAQDLLRTQPGEDNLERWVAAARTDDGKEIVIYTGGGDPIELDPNLAGGIKPGSAWVSPRSGEQLRVTPPSAPGGASAVVRFVPPNDKDWVLWLRFRQ